MFGQNVLDIIELNLFNCNFFYDLYLSDHVLVARSIKIQKILQGAGAREKSSFHHFVQGDAS